MEKNETSATSPDNFDILNGNLRNNVMKRNHDIGKQSAFDIEREI